MLNVVEPTRHIKVFLLFLHCEVHLHGEEIQDTNKTRHCNHWHRNTWKDKIKVDSFTSDFNSHKVVQV